MNLELVVCPGCRTLTGDRLDLRTLQRDGDRLTCACGCSYPIVDGVPIVVADADARIAAETPTVGEPEDAPYPRLLEYLSLYLDAHWGDRAEPAEGFAGPELVAKIADRARSPVARAVELGCSTGRIVAELAAGADHVVGLDLQLGAVRHARRLLDGERVEYGRRIHGQHYAPTVVRAGDRALSSERRTLLCADALDPPLVPGMFDRVVALNLLDSVPHPRVLLAVLDGLTAPGGELILASPFTWQSSVTVESERIGGADPAAELPRLLGAGYTIEDQADLGWTLRRDARSTLAYRTHYLRARKR